MRDFGAKGDGVSDDATAINAASRSFINNGGGIVRLECGRKYFVGSSLLIGTRGTPGSDTEPAVTLEGCTPNADSIVRPRGFTGGIDTLGGIIRAPGATISISQNGGLRDLLIWQKGVMLNQDSYENFAGTAITLGPGGTGQATRVENVTVVGAKLCYDGSNGGNRAVALNVLCDGIDGFDIGASYDGAYYNQLHPFPIASNGFAGYAIRAISGNGATTTVRYSGNPSRSIAVGDMVRLTGLKYSRSGSPAYAIDDIAKKYSVGSANYISQSWIVSAVGEGFLKLASKVNTATDPVSWSDAAILDMNSSYFRPGTGIKISAEVHSDDTFFGKLFDFGHATGVEFSGVGLYSVGSIYVDSNSKAGVVLSSTSPSPVHVGNIEALGMGYGPGVVLGGMGFYQIGSINTSNTTDGISFRGGFSQIGRALVTNAYQFGFRVTAGAKAQIGAARTQNTPRPLSTASEPLSDFVIQNLSTDLDPGNNLVTQGGPTPDAAVIDGRIIEIPNARAAVGNMGCNFLTVSGEATYNEIRGGSYAGQCFILSFTSTGRLERGHNISLVGGRTFGGLPGNAIMLFWDGVTPRADPGGTFREGWRTNGQ